MNKKIAIGIVVGCMVVVAIIFGVRFFSGVLGTSTQTPANLSPGNIPPAAITEASLSSTTYEIALAHAQEWQSAAVLYKMELVDAPSGKWDFIFVSPLLKGKGFEVIAAGQTVVSTTPVTISGGGTTLPANLISPDQAMATAREIPGYATTPVISLELLYNSVVKQWYWGVKMSSGSTVTIKATP